jgi:hypothetical protein
MFRQRLGDPAWRLTLNHLTHYNFSSDWKIPVAPEAYTRSGKQFGDQYSNFNAGKLLLYLEGLAGLEYSVPDKKLVVHDTMPTNWTWMEVRLPIEMPGEKKTRWPVIRYERTGVKNEDGSGSEITKSIRVTDCPLQITIEPWSEEKRVIRSSIQPANGGERIASNYPHYPKYAFDASQSTAYVQLRLDTTSESR